MNKTTNYINPKYIQSAQSMEKQSHSKMQMVFYLWVILVTSMALFKSNCWDEDKFLMIEELLQEFFNTYPELQKTPQANINFENNHKYLNEICDKYTSINEVSIPTGTESTTNNIQNNVVSIEGNQNIEKVRKNFILEI